MRFTRFVSALGLLSLLGLVPWLAGCGRGAPAPAGADSQATQEAKSATPSEGGKAGGLDQLDQSDRKLAEKQKVCPVSGNVLGEMGKPYKVIIQGRTIFLCCKDCETELRAHPDKYLKKLEK